MARASMKGRCQAMSLSERARASMKRVTIPRTDLRVSRICLGTAGMGSEMGQKQSFAMLDAFVAAGGNFLDTAHVYADWLPGEKHRSEKTIGQWLKKSGQRDQVVLATKGAHPDLATMHISRLSPQEIAADVAESLDCLGLRAIDLYWLHRDDPARPVGEIMEALNEQIRAGRVRHVGCSNWRPGRIQEAQSYAAAHGLASFVASQPMWSLAMVNPGTVPDDIAVVDDEALAYYRGAEMAVIPFSSQARGFFAQASAGGVDALKEGVRRTYENDQSRARLTRAQDLARRLGASVTAVALASITAQPFVAVPIVGCRSLDQLADTLASADLTLTPAQLDYLTTGHGS